MNVYRSSVRTTNELKTSDGMNIYSSPIRLKPPQAQNVGINTATYSPRVSIRSVGNLQQQRHSGADQVTTSTFCSNPDQNIR